MDFVSFSPGERGRVVVAEGNPVTAGALSWLLREQGYLVTSVSNRDELFAAINRSTPDLILIDDDVLEPDAAVLGALRSDDRWHDVRVIVTAPWSEIEDSAGALPWGADDCVSEPFRVPELLGRVRTQLRASWQLRAARTELRDTTAELERARDDAVSNRRLVDILHEITGELAAGDIYRLLARRVAEALEISHCSIILARSDDALGTIAATREDSAIRDTTIQLEAYPEIRAELESGHSVLVDDAATHPLYAEARAKLAHENQTLDICSVATIPFSIDRVRSGVLFLRTDRSQRNLTADDVAFCEVVLRAAVAAIRRAQALETTRAENRRLEALATTDPLTRVLNRRALLDRLNAEVDRARRYDSSLTLLLLDLDHFKQINDTAGHLAGDTVLRQIGALLEEAIRKVDIVARYGGEEFVVILPETLSDGGVAFAERLRERIAAESFDVGAGRAVHLTVSIGIATFPSPLVSSTEDLFARADEALYRAKSGGRNQVKI
jgi:two-component system cell cycle response regulator